MEQWDKVIVPAISHENRGIGPQAGRGWEGEFLPGFYQATSPGQTS